ncbi:beta-ketoacyl synthase N-terminal-like domain-containing protein [Flavobacterium sp. H122]|uniref:beta-ketoacyl synthase N-terminal-like domain-containing protein n=1 Tax=Flavobacterium sp. H122 TaxID=2529860 RepID=UPI0010AA0A90|nr:beta-ketoacyl synthase N-terminal-like domain-containing protein [Flavobacterium sp. H122]
MKGCYINGMGIVSAQNTFEAEFLENTAVNTTDAVIYAQQPSYKELIPPAMIRRMAKGVKMGIYASTKALNEAGIKNPDAIITGTGMGCVEDSEKFLKAILDNNEEFLTPTSFIQSTHNTVAGQIALGLQCKSYNFTYVNGAVSLETALIDAKMQLDAGEAQSVLVGGIDETAEHTISLFKLINIIKKEEDLPGEIVNPVSKGVVFSEGAAFFALENENKASSYAKVLDVEIKNIIKSDEVEEFIQNFLTLNNITAEQIDAIVLGNNGDSEFDHFYDGAKKLLKNAPQVYYKHLSGEYNTASGFGLWMTSSIIKHQTIPPVVKMNDIEKSEYQYVLMYNQYQGKDHSLILLQKC